MTTITPVKHALVVRRCDAPWITLHNHADPAEPVIKEVSLGFFQRPVYLADRATCETNEEELQLLPYMTLRRFCNDNTIRYFSYTRGNSGGEGRLYKKLSIGIGGHVDRLPDLGQGLLDLLQDEAAREFSEEVGVPIPNGPRRIDFTHYIFDPETPVGRVHVGLHCVVDVYSGGIGDFILEHSIIEDGRWMTALELLSSGVFERLEPWSQLVASHLYISPPPRNRGDL